jgi:hypothetical protein
MIGGGVKEVINFPKSEGRWDAQSLMSGFIAVMRLSDNNSSQQLDALRVPQKVHPTNQEGQKSEFRWWSRTCSSSRTFARNLK